MNIGCGKKGPIVEKDVTLDEDQVVEKKEEKNMMKIGKPAPLFEAEAYYNGGFTNVKLEDYKGKWVLLCFYPGDFTFVWSTEVSAVAEKYDVLKDLDVEVLSVSVDSPFVHKVWNDQELSKMIDKDIPFPMLSDSSGAIGSMYGVYDEEAGVNTRGRFIIDPDGVVQAFEVLTPPVGRNFSEAVRQIQAYQMVRETKGAEVAPAGWKPGKATLKPGPELVGNIWKEWKVSQAFED